MRVGADRASVDALPARLATVLVAVAALAVVAWRLTLGASPEDDGHAVALALRLSRGDIALADELNLQVTGSLLAVPFVWAWDHLVGTTGIVLASRVWFVVVAGAVGLLTARALRTRYAAGPAALASAAALLGLPYQLPLLSYSSVPVLALVLAAASGIALRQTRSLAWAAVLGGATAVGTIASPQLAPAFALALLIGMARVEGTRPRLVATASSLGLLAVAAVGLLITAGPAPIEESVRFLLAVRGDGISPLVRLGRALGTYEGLRFPLYWPLLAGLAVTALGCARPGWRALRVTASAAGMLWATAVTVGAALGVLPQLWFGNTVAALESVLVVTLALPVIAELRWSPRPGDGGDLLAAAVPGLVAATVIAATTGSGPEYSVHGAALGGLLLVLVVQWSTSARSLWAAPRPTTARMRAAIALSAVPTLGMALGFLALPFHEPGSLGVDTRITAGPWAGLVTTDNGAARLATLTRTVDDATRGGRSILILGAAGGYLAANGPMATPALWLEDYGAANQKALDWFQRTGRAPDVVLVTSIAEKNAGGEAAWVQHDPLRAWIQTAYPVRHVIPGLGTLLERQ